MVKIRKTGGDGASETTKQASASCEDKASTSRARGTGSRAAASRRRSSAAGSGTAGDRPLDGPDGLRQGEEAMEQARARWEELKASAEEAERRLQAVREQAAQARCELDEVQQEAARVHGQSREALEGFRQTGQFLASAREDSETVGKQFKETQQQLQT